MKKELAELPIEGHSAFLFNYQQTDLLEKRVKSVKIRLHNSIYEQ